MRTAPCSGACETGMNYIVDCCSSDDDIGSAMHAALAVVLAFRVSTHSTTCTASAATCSTRYSGTVMCIAGGQSASP